MKKIKVNSIGTVSEPKAAKYKFRVTLKENMYKFCVGFFNTEEEYKALLGKSVAAITMQRNFGAAQDQAGDRLEYYGLWADHIASVKEEQAASEVVVREQLLSDIRISEIRERSKVAVANFEDILNP